MIYKTATDAENDAANALVDVLASEMAAALDGQMIICNGEPTAEFVRHREIGGKRRRVRITVAMVNAD